ncbi:hypothetical protein IC617_08940 [Neiella sp. HB171785]|uniref:Uncharacterized protein n=1 Tax=Neiella litorisoli TaxID=2771431 RepID=A0A8J6UIZ6_9GAMM|nr:hypothetical protein [Neiella litorisoli]MBD1389553.1 hypothetical protein [Neiella litorisoli]
MNKPDFRLVLVTVFIDGKQLKPGSEIITRPDRSGLSVYMAANNSFVGVAMHDEIYRKTARSIPKSSLAGFGVMDFKVIPSTSKGFDVAIRTPAEQKARIVLGVSKELAVTAKNLLCEELGGRPC